MARNRLQEKLVKMSLLWKEECLGHKSFQRWHCARRMYKVIPNQRRSRRTHTWICTKCGYRITVVRGV